MLMRELALHILDVARNSLEAGAKRVMIAVTERPTADVLEVLICDDGCGMDHETVARAADPFYTTRTTRKVGLGLSLLRAACERCGGEFSMQSEPGRGTAIRCTFGLKHIDRPPLGDMGKVIQALACEAERTNLRYRHQVNAETFEIDTVELQKELGEVPIHDPRVLCWLAEYVKNGIVAVGSKA